MAAIDLLDLTNSTDESDGTGIFDKLIQSVNRHIGAQYEDGRITGADYASVYLGSLQSVLSESVKFILAEQEAGYRADLLLEQILTEQKKNEVAGLIDLEKQKMQEQIDLVIAQTATQYESVQSSRQDTTRKNLLNTKHVIKTEKETEMLISQNNELLASGPLDRDLTVAKTEATDQGKLDNTNKVTAEVALTNAQELHQEDITLTKLPEEVDLLQSKDAEQLADTIRKDAESTEKIALLDAQTIGFRADGKQKLLKTMMDGSAVNTTTSGLVFDTHLTKDVGVEALANDILDDWSSPVNIGP